MTSTVIGCALNQAEESMSSEDHGMHSAGPESVIASELPSLSDWNVQSNEGCDVHSTAGDWNAHSNDTIDLAPEFTPTQETSAQVQWAYDYLKSALFENKLPNCSKLPDCLITYQRHNRSYGYFAPKRFGRNDGQLTDEIAINPQHFPERTIEEILSTLAHEMVHLWQYRFGKPGRPGYHNKEWADQMEAIGLIPSSTGREGGKRTGDAISHYIKPDGPFALAVEKLVATGFEITWREVVASDRASSGGTDGNDEGNAPLSGKRTKFTCPTCGDNAWGKAELNLVCGRHGQKMVPSDRDSDR